MSSQSDIRAWVFDPQPADGSGPVLVGPFPSKTAAAEWANVEHPDDGDGLAVVFRATLVAP